MQQRNRKSIYTVYYPILVSLTIRGYVLPNDASHLQFFICSSVFESAANDSWQRLNMPVAGCTCKRSFKRWHTHLFFWPRVCMEVDLASRLPPPVLTHLSCLSLGFVDCELRGSRAALNSLSKSFSNSGSFNFSSAFLLC